MQEQQELPADEQDIKPPADHQSDMNNEPPADQQDNTNRELSADRKHDAAREQPVQDQDSLQYNKQDLDQEQRVDVKPVQCNTQNLSISVGDKNGYASRISGVVFMENTRRIAQNADVYLLFGNESRYPVCKNAHGQQRKFCHRGYPAGVLYTICQAGHGPAVRGLCGKGASLPARVSDAAVKIAL